MITAHIGEICAFAAAVNWALALVLFKLSGESIPPLSLSLFKNVVGIILLGLTLPFVVGADLGIGELSASDLGILLLSGVVGIAIADTILFYSLNLIGVGLVTIVECTYTPSVILFAFLFLSEQVETYHYVGGAMVLSAVFISSTHRPPANRTRGQILLGMLLGILAIALMALGIVVAKPILEHTPLVPAALVRVIGGTTILAILMAFRPNRSQLFRVFKPSKGWKTSLPASVLGMYVSMLLWIAGYKYAEATTAAILNQTSTVLALIFATLILKEPFTRSKLMGALLALSGVVVITCFGG